MAKKKWYKRPGTLITIGAVGCIGVGSYLFYKAVRRAQAQHDVEQWLNWGIVPGATSGIGQPPFRFGPEGMSDRYRGMAWELDLPISSDPSACAARGSGPAAQMCFELQRARQHTRNYMEGRGGRASMDAANQAMENAMRSYYQVRQRGIIGPKTSKTHGNVVMGMYGG